MCCCRSFVGSIIIRFPLCEAWGSYGCGEKEGLLLIGQYLVCCTSWNAAHPTPSHYCLVLAGHSLCSEQDSCAETTPEEAEVHILESSDEADKTSKVWNFHLHIVNSRSSAGWKLACWLHSCMWLEDLFQENVALVFKVFTHDMEWNQLDPWLQTIPPAEPKCSHFAHHGYAGCCMVLMILNATKVCASLFTVWSCLNVACHILI